MSENQGSEEPEWRHPAPGRWTADYGGHALAVEAGPDGLWAATVDGVAAAVVFAGQRARFGRYEQAQRFVLRSFAPVHAFADNGRGYCVASAGLPVGWHCEQGRFWPGHQPGGAR